MPNLLTKPTLTSAALAGAATLGTAWGLQKAYKATNYYPPTPVFWFAIGASASLLLAALAPQKTNLTRLGV